LSPSLHLLGEQKDLTGAPLVSFTDGACRSTGQQEQIKPLVKSGSRKEPWKERAASAEEKQSLAAASSDTEEVDDDTGDEISMESRARTPSEPMSPTRAIAALPSCELRRPSSSPKPDNPPELGKGLLVQKVVEIDDLITMPRANEFANKSFLHGELD
jgi:hypothetical protein